jgi:hypothetical protein
MRPAVRGYFLSTLLRVERVTIINCAMANKYWPGQNPVDKQVGAGWTINPRQAGAPAGIDSPIQLDHRLNIRQLLFSRFDEPDTTPTRVLLNFGGRAADLQFTAFARRCTLLGI